MMDHRQRAEDLISQVSVSADKALEAAGVHAILALCDQFNALAVVLAAQLAPHKPPEVRTQFTPGAAQFGPPSPTPAAQARLGDGRRNASTA